MVTHHCGSIATIVLVAGAVGLPNASHAQEVEQRFDIPAGPATSTINAFAKQAGINVLASEEILAGVCTNDVRGSLPASAALQRLLSGTGLYGKVTGSGAVFILPIGTTRGHRAGSTDGPGQRKAACCAVSAAILIMCGAPAGAQGRAVGNGHEHPGGSADDPVKQVLVVAARASQQSSIERKKNAATVLNAIVAEDAGSLPDRNIGEARGRPPPRPTVMPHFIEFFIEGRNLGNATTSNSQAGCAAFAAGTPNLLDYAYAGRRTMVG